VTTAEKIGKRFSEPKKSPKKISRQNLRVEESCQTFSSEMHAHLEPCLRIILHFIFSLG
jgi:hypothetical protein